MTSLESVFLIEIPGGTIKKNVVAVIVQLVLCYKQIINIKTILGSQRYFSVRFDCTLFYEERKGTQKAY